MHEYGLTISQRDTGQPAGRNSRPGQDPTQARAADLLHQGGTRGRIFALSFEMVQNGNRTIQVEIMADQEEKEEKPVDRARRRLLKQGIYLAPVIISLTAFTGTAKAQNPHVIPSSKVSPSQKVDAKVSWKVA
jgi:hypothetical protein